jgi:hypothetical protein
MYLLRKLINPPPSCSATNAMLQQAQAAVDEYLANCPDQIE